jgi:hypothetical protein
VFGARLLSVIFGLKAGEETGGSIQLHNEEFHYTYSSLIIIRMIKSMRMI